MTTMVKPDTRKTLNRKKSNTNPISKLPLNRSCLRHIVRSCAKNGNHDSFVPFKDLSLKDLPQDIRYNTILEKVCQLGQRVVRVKVGPTSDKCRTIGMHQRSGNFPRTCTGLVTSAVDNYFIVVVPAHAIKNDFEVKIYKF